MKDYVYFKIKVNKKQRTFVDRCYMLLYTITPIVFGCIGGCMVGYFIVMFLKYVP